MKNWSVRASRNCWLSSMLAPCSKSSAVTVATMPRWSGQDRMSTFSVGTSVVSGIPSPYVGLEQGRTWSASASLPGAEPGQNGWVVVVGRVLGGCGGRASAGGVDAGRWSVGSSRVTPGWADLGAVVAVVVAPGGHRRGVGGPVGVRCGVRGGTRARCAARRAGRCGPGWCWSRRLPVVVGRRAGRRRGRTLVCRASAGWVVRTRPVGSVQVATPSVVSTTFQPGRCLTRWWRRHTVSRLVSRVGPWGQGRTWSRSQKMAAMVQPGKRQRRSRALIRSAVRLDGR